MQKFVDQVEHVTFSGPYAISKGQTVLYITERCVFSLTEEGLELMEIAPGIDLERDILRQMAFQPIIKGTPRLMDRRIFNPAADGSAGGLAKPELDSSDRGDLGLVAPDRNPCCQRRLSVS